MEEHWRKIRDVVAREFASHIDQVAGAIKDDKDFGDAIQKAIESRLGQIHNMDLWSQLADIYAEMLNSRLGR